MRKFCIGLVTAAATAVLLAGTAAPAAAQIDVGSLITSLLVGGGGMG